MYLARQFNDLSATLTTDARSTYENFLNLWKDVDSDIRILKQSQGRIREAAIYETRYEECRSVDG